MEKVEIGVQFLAEARYILFSTASERDLRSTSLLYNQRGWGEFS
jgi:hypothetical protein